MKGKFKGNSVKGWNKREFQLTESELAGSICNINRMKQHQVFTPLWQLSEKREHDEDWFDYSYLLPFYSELVLQPLSYSDQKSNK